MDPEKSELADEERMKDAEAAPEIPVLYLDDTMIAASKPGGLLVHRTKQSSDRVVLLQALAGQTGTYLYPVHRLDRGASGVIVFGTSSASARDLQRVLGEEATRKEYLVLVRGSTLKRFTSERPLTSDTGDRRPQPARTDFERLAELSRCSLLRARIHTGRRHQIRRHLAHLAHQVIGDTSYGKGRINRFFRETYGLPRLFLHARRLEITHPVTGTRLSLEAPLADDLARFLERLPDCPPGLLTRI